ncbi:hypothetical protein CDCA_CDCA04G1314 [Cyanidium caldarium]|uniref:Uncharacterized protein n=1 Tax=Cyanidium caldarium TaxID=2771 RepID=A0AAV9ISL1_CYACA|nr:hypothetical protein CDCA_CDCA04G1314 [Cyanidium caldarium]
MPTWLAKMWLALLLLLWAGAHCHTVIAAPSGMVWEEALHEISLLRETVSATELPAAPASALTPPDLTPDAEHALCAQLCPGSPEHCGVKFIYGTGTVYCCTLALYVQGSIGHVCADSSQPHLVPEAALTSAVQASVHAGSIDKPTPAPLPNDRNKTDLAVGGRYALERVNQVRVAQRLDPIVWNEQVSDGVLYWLQYLDETHLFMNQNLGQPAKPFPTGSVFLAEVVLSHRLLPNTSIAEAGRACGNALLAHNGSLEIMLGHYEFGAVGILKRRTGLQWLCSVSLGKLFGYGGTSFSNSST